MKARITTLDNGLRVVSEVVADMPSVTLGVWVAAGSRAEREEENGIAHVLEHMAFKGTKTRSARDIAEAIENVGGDMNASTSYEQTTYYARMLAENLGLAADILGDILNNSVFDEKEFEREKLVIGQEISATLDSPEELIFDLMQEACFPDQPLGRSIAGTIESVGALKRDNIISFMAENYSAPHCIIAAAGAVDHEELVAHAAKNFSKLPGKEIKEPQSAQFKGVQKRIFRDTQQVQIAFAYPGTPYYDCTIFAAHVFAALLGGGMSSRLFQEAREVRGLCYNISAFNWPFSDTGVFGMSASTSPSLVKDLTPVMLDVLHAAAKNANEIEVARAKAQCKAGLLMAFENTPARAEHLARTLIVHGRVLPLVEIVERIETVNVNEVRNFAGRMLDAKNAAFAAIGPEKSLPTAPQLEAWGLQG
jgi:predicted Zn-dependent peptidase